MSKVYCGVGNGYIGAGITSILEEIGKVMAINGYVLRSGGGKGADSAFERGCDSVEGKKEIFLPEAGYNGSDSKLFDLPKEDEARKIAAKYHHSWNMISASIKKVMTRTSYEVFGEDLTDPVEFVIGYVTDSGSAEQVLRVARAYNIPVYNLGNTHDYKKKELKDFIKKFAEEKGLRLG